MDVSPPNVAVHDTRTCFDVIVIGASAGGQPAIAKVLAGLPRDLHLSIVVMLHLAPEAGLPTFARNTHPSAWITHATRIGERKVLIAPPRSFAELLPDGSFMLSACPTGALERPIDRLLDSTSRSFGPRAIGVILTGMGNDGALGARELRVAGGRVIVQALGTADYADMPAAAIAAGAADLVVPLDDIGPLIGEIVGGTPHPRTRSEQRAVRRTFGAAGEIARLAAEIDWSQTPLGGVLGWPEELKIAVRTAVDAPQPTAICWGPDLIQLYNDRWRAFLGARHPHALGRPARETWAELWSDVMEPIAKGVMTRGEALVGEDFPFMLPRRGFVEEVFVTVSCSPIRGSAGQVLGVQSTGWETTRSVLAERRTRLLHALGIALAGAPTPSEACTRAASALTVAPADLPFVLLYLTEPSGQRLSLAGVSGLQPGSPAAPYVLSANTRDDGEWPMAAALGSAMNDARVGLVVDDLRERFPGLKPPPTSPKGSLAPRRARMVPLSMAGRKRPLGVLILGLSPHRAEDEAHARFVDLVVQHVIAALGAAMTKELARERVERLDELDRAKTEFFSNVSHEFRTPLTLMLAPLDELVRSRRELPSWTTEGVEVAARNARRLLRLVNSLLDFSSIDTHRQRPTVTSTDLGTLTTDIASAFRSAIEAAGLALRIDVAEDLPRVPVDVEMWEKIVSNLLSNAFKFTFSGSIRLRLRSMPRHVQLEVFDTGVGIPAAELANVFKRFHRVHGTRARTAEGSGIGLAIARDLVQRMGGQIAVYSAENVGTRFTIWMPLSSRCDVDERSEASPRASEVTTLLADEASRWTRPDDWLEGRDMLEPAATSGPKRGRLLVVDDNADIREHLRRLFGAQRWEVDVASDGASALLLAGERRPDLVLADVMMPGMDGFALLRAIRADEVLRATPVIVVTAFAGEEAAVRAGADDCVAKPFSARELLARVEGQIALARMRRRTEEGNALLLRFSDAARALTAPRSIARLACRVVAEHLRSEQVQWLRVDRASGSFVVEGMFVADGVELSAYLAALWSSEPFSSACGRGQSLVLDDAGADARLTAATQQALAATGVGAAIGIPVLAEGRLRGVLCVAQRAPRRWLPEVVALVEGVAGRCWSELERADSSAALRLAVEHETVLREELQQRVRTIIAVIRSIHARTADGAQSVEHYASLMAGRLATLARAQSLLASGVNVGVDLREILREAFAAEQRTLDAHDLDGPDVVLCPKAAEVMTMVIHELVINAVRFGALSTPEGRVSVRWTRDACASAPSLRFVWTERGGPKATDTGRRGFGTDVVERRVAHELRGTGRLLLTPRGARCEIAFPLPVGASTSETLAPATEH